MNWEAIAAIGQMLGSIAVFVTLGYLAVQIRHNANATRMSTAQHMTDRWVSINLHMANDPAMFARDLRSHPSQEERQATIAFWRAVFHQYASNHYQHTRGALDEILFRPTEREIAVNSSHSSAGPNLRIAWAQARYIYDDEFCRFMDDILAANPPPEDSNTSGT